MASSRLELPDFPEWEKINSEELHKLNKTRPFLMEIGMGDRRSLFAIITRYPLLKSPVFSWGYDIDIFDKGVIVKLWGDGENKTPNFKSVGAAILFNGAWHVLQFGERLICLYEFNSETRFLIRVILKVYDMNLVKKFELVVNKRARHER